MKKQLVLVVVVMFALMSTVAFADVINRSDPDFVYQGTNGTAPRDGGDTCATPTGIVGPLPYVDAGDSCGATNTVTNYTGTCTLAFPYAGEDEIYEVTLGGGNSVSFSADLTGSTGDLALFLISTCNDGTTCVANSQDAIGPAAGPELIDTATYGAGTYYLYVDSYYAAGNAGSCGTYTLTVAGTLPVELTEFGIE